MTKHFWVEARNTDTRNCHNKLWLGRQMGILFAWGWVTVKTKPGLDGIEDARIAAREYLGTYDEHRLLMVYPEDRVEGGYNPKDDFKVDKATAAKIKF